ncbi:hypothetical protein KU306_14755 [Haloferax larsenii]|uniref:Uncharacterized protein n=1 Tax=Haloferax larsenii TaxID=302484 RepID=A0ABY5RCQ2_HALLR|nr:hypothetical protein [Haloferax larsenii]UVE50144.1 hypothetical protein KU306_14755 [Haloferax larsenii]
MADFTLFEVHLHDGFEFSPTNRAPLMGAQDESDDDYDVEFEDDAEVDYEAEYESASKGGSKMGLLFGLVLLIGIAAGVRYLRGGDDLDELADLDEREEVELGA